MNNAALQDEVARLKRRSITLSKSYQELTLVTNHKIEQLERQVAHLRESLSWSIR